MFRFLLQACSRNRVRWVGDLRYIHPYIYLLFFPLWEGSQRNKRVVMGDSPPSREEAFLAAASLMRIEK